MSSLRFIIKAIKRTRIGIELSNTVKFNVGLARREDVDYFNLICGIASLLGFILTVANVFPTHANIRNSFTIFATGCFFGGLVGGVKGFVINFPQNPVSSGILLFYIISGVGLLFTLLAGLISNEKERRQECFNVVGCGFVGLLIAGFIILLGHAAGTAPSVDRERFPLDDLLVVADLNLSKGNMDRAIQELELFISYCPSSDLRADAAKKKIEQLKKMQAEKLFH